MAKGVNKVILIGNLGKEPDLRYFPNGDAVCNITLATSDSWTDKASGERKEKTEWHNVVFRKKLAEVAGQYLKKGSKIYVEGYLQTRKWEKDGVDQFMTEVIVRDMQMLDGKPADGAAASGGGYSRPETRKAAAASSAPASSSPPDAGFEDDDIPF